MPDELNTPTHRWYQPRNNIKLAASDFSAQYIKDSGIQKIDAFINLQSWGNPIPSLFAASEPGVWYDPSDMTTLFQDAAGATPVTAVEQAVGRMLDKSGRGNHATQSVAGSRPVLSARYNVLTYSELLSNAAWVNGSIASGTRTNGSVSVSVAGGYSYVRQSINVSSAVDHTVSFDITCDQTIANVPIRCAGAFASNSSLVNMTANQTVRVSLSGIKTDFWLEVGIDVRSGVVPGGSTSTGYTVTFNRVDLRPTNDGVGIPVYQRVTTSTDYDTSGFPPYLRFDGTDDFLITGSIDFSATDAVTMFAGARRLLDGSVALLAEISASSFSTPGTFGMFAPGAITNLTPFSFRSTGSVTSAADPNNAIYSAPSTNVVTGIGKISTDTALLRMNGTQVATSAIDQGTGNYTSQPLYIGRRGGTTLAFNGRLYSLIVRGAASTAAQISSAEAWVNSKTGAY